MGNELRDLFVARITHDLAELGIHIYCRRSPRQAGVLRDHLCESLAFFLDSYLPLIIAANHLCSVEDDWTDDLRRLWKDFETLMASRIKYLQNHPPDPEAPPKATARIKCLDRNDPIGLIMLEEFELLFPRVLKEQSSRFITRD